MARNRNLDFLERELEASPRCLELLHREPERRQVVARVGLVAAGGECQEKRRKEIEEK